MRQPLALAFVSGLLVVGACGRSDLELGEYVFVDQAGAAGVSGSGGSSGKAGASGAGGKAGAAGAAGKGGASGSSGKAGASGSSGKAGASGASGKAGSSGSPPDGGVDAPPDAPMDGDAEAGCSSDAQCDDKIACTHDSCEAGLCQHQPDDKLCDDGLFCTGVEVCNPQAGCGTIPVTCDDGVACTVESCDEGLKSCVSTPDDSLCPLSHKCGPGEGCYALAYAHSQDFLYEVRVPSGKVNPIGPLGDQLTDIALSPNGVLYGLSYNALFTIDASSGNTTFLDSISAGQVVAMDAAPDGTLYTGGPQLYVIDPQVGALKTVASYPPGYQGSGDLAFLQGRLLASARKNGNGNGGSDQLVEFDLASGSAKFLGDIGHDCVWGLAAFGETLYGLTCNGEVLSIDPNTGSSVVLGNAGVAFWGASAR